MATLNYNGRLINITDQRVSTWISNKNSQNRLFAITDSEGRVIFDIDKDGHFIRENIEEDLDNHLSEYLSKYFRHDTNYLFAIVDDENNVIFSIDRKGNYSIDEQVYSDIKNNFTNVSNDLLFTIVDPNDKIIFSVDKTGKCSISEQVFELINSYFSAEAPLLTYAVTDKEGKLLIGVNNQGELDSPVIDNFIDQKLEAFDAMDYDYVDTKVNDEKMRAEGVESELRTAIDSIEPTVVIGGDNNPDEEFLASVDDKLTIKDITNSVNSKNIVYIRKTDDIFDKIVSTNTVYVITFTHDLNNTQLNMPAGCSIIFNGGCLYNGILNGNDTIVKSNFTKCFGAGLTFAGTFIMEEIHANYFVNSTTINELQKINSLLNDSCYNKIVIDEGTYYFQPLHDKTSELQPDDLLQLSDNTELIVDGTINVVPNGFTHYHVVTVMNSENVKIHGNGVLFGDSDTHDYTTIASTHEWCHGIHVLNESKNIEVYNIHLQNFPGDGISVDGVDDIVYNAHIHDIEIKHCGRQGISIESVHDAIIENCNITDIYRTPPMAAIDIEPWTSVRANNIVIRNIHFEDCYGVNIFFADNVYVENITGKKSRLLSIKLASNVKVNNAILSDISVGKTVIERYDSANNVQLSNVNVNSDNLTYADLQDIKIDESCSFGSNCIVNNGPAIGSTRINNSVYQYFDGTQWTNF